MLRHCANAATSRSGTRFTLQRSASNFFNCDLHYLSSELVINNQNIKIICNVSKSNRCSTDIGWWRVTAAVPNDLNRRWWQHPAIQHIIMQLPPKISTHASLVTFVIMQTNLKSVCLKLKGLIMSKERTDRWANLMSRYDRLTACGIWQINSCDFLGFECEKQPDTCHLFIHTAQNQHLRTCNYQWDLFHT